MLFLIFANFEIDKHNLYLTLHITVLYALYFSLSFNTLLIFEHNVAKLVRIIY